MQPIKLTIAQEAADWFVRHRGGLCSPQEQAEFAAWLKSSPLHVEEYLRTAVASRDLQAAARSMETSVDAVLESVPSSTDRVVVPLSNTRSSNSSRPRLLWPALAAAAAAAVVLVVAGGIWLQRDGQRFGLPKAYRTAHAEQRSWLLPDGSSLSLDSDTSVVVSFNDRERLVHLERGEALFQVAHEPARRFRVSAGDAGVIAIGTEFDVVRAPNSTRVTVVEGKVAVFTGDAPQVSAQAMLPSQATALNAGEQIRIDDHSQPSKPALINVQRAVAWVHHQIAFDQQPLGEVTDEFNHYSGIPIVIEDERVRGILISGVFDAYDTDSFVKFISRLDNVNVEERADRIIVSDSSK
jgi:transmembrane sensor